MGHSMNAKAVIAGYFLILANDLEEAINIAKANPSMKID